MKLKNKISSIFLVAFIVAFSFVNVQAITVDRQYIGNNRSYRALRPQGLVIHSTANPGATAQNNRDYFNRVYVSSSAHYFVDWMKTIQTIPEAEQAWHAGPYANHRYLSIEMCEPRNRQSEFNAVYKNTVELAADMCKRYGWSASNIISHSYVSNTWHQTDHEDPIAFLRKYGKSWRTLINDIQKAINGQNITINKPSVNTDNSVRDKKAKIVNINTYLNVRYTPGGKKIGKLHNGDTVTLWRREGDWYHIYSPAKGYKQAYIHKDYVQISGKNNINYSLDGKIGTLTGNGVRVRSSKTTSTNRNILGNVYKGDKVRLYRREGEWLHVYYPKHGGYVYAKYIKY